MFHCISGNNMPSSSGGGGSSSSPGGPLSLGSSGGGGGGVSSHLHSSTAAGSSGTNVTLSPSLMNPFSSWYTSNSLGSYYSGIGFSRSDIKHVFPGPLF